MNYRDYREKRIKAAGILDVIWALDLAPGTRKVQVLHPDWIAEYFFGGRPEDMFWILGGTYLFRLTLDSVLFPEDPGEDTPG